MHPSHRVDAYPDVYCEGKVALWSQRVALEADIRAAQHRQRRSIRRQIIVKQLLQVGVLVKHLQEENGSSAKSEPALLPPPPTIHPEEHLSSIESMVMKLIQQNEELQALVKNQQIYPNRRNCDESSKARVQSPVQKDGGSSSNDSVSVDIDHSASNDSSSPPARSKMKAASSRSAWEMLESLPEIEWTDNDEQLLEKLVSGNGDGNRWLPGSGDATQTATTDNGEGELSSMLPRKQQDRQESRRKIAQLFDMSAMSTSTGIRRPRWRIEQDIENGVIRPFDAENDGTVTEQPMPLRQIFRSAVVAVCAVFELQSMLLEKKLRLREKSIQDLEPMFSVYFDATRAWLGKVVKTPLLSIVQDPGLDMDVSTKAGLFQASEGFFKLFRGRRSSNSSTVQPKSGAKASSGVQSRMVKLKVRVKGIIDSVSKAIEKGDVPSGILEFWKRLTSDGVYFPSTYPLCASERQALELDSLGATRLMEGTCTSFSGQSYSRFQIALVNFVMVRILIPCVVMRPWEVGVGGENPPRAVTSNLKNLASVLYLIISRLSPVPPVGDADVGPGLRFGGRRRSLEVVPVQNDQELLFAAVPTAGNNTFEDNEPGQRRFLSVLEITRLLIPEKFLPVRELEDFIGEQQTRLRSALVGLQARLHPPREEEDPTDGFTSK